GNQISSIGEGTLAAVVIVLSCLQVSKVRFRSFKDVALRSRRALFVISTILAGAALIVALQWPSALIFVGLLSAYVILGVFEEIVFHRRRRAEEQAAPGRDA